MIIENSRSVLCIKNTEFYFQIFVFTITKYIIMQKLTTVVRILVRSTLAVRLSITELVFRNAVFLCLARTSFLTTRTIVVLHGNTSTLHYQDNIIK